MTATRVPYLVDLPPIGEDATHFRRVLTDILEGHATQINRGATRSAGSATWNTQFTVSADLSLVDATAGTVTAFLPFAIDGVDQMYTLKAVSTTNVIIAHAQAGELIDAAASKTVSGAYASMQFLSDGKQWWSV